MLGAHMSVRGNRVVVTGMGLRSPLGHTPAALGEGLLAGRSGIRAMAGWEGLDGLRTRVGAPCDGIDNSSIPRKYSRTMGRVAVLAALSVRDAIADSGVPGGIIASPSCGVAFGSTVGSTVAQEDFLRPILNDNTLRGILASTYLQFMSHTCAANIAMMFGCKGPVIASCTACTSGSQGVGIAYEQVRFGRVPICLGGGAEELHMLHAGIFDIMRATSVGYAETPERTPRPFDRRRDGLVVGEGSGCLVLEEYEHARRRGATMQRSSAMVRAVTARTRPIPIRTASALPFTRRCGMPSWGQRISSTSTRTRPAPTWAMPRRPWPFTAFSAPRCR